MKIQFPTAFKILKDDYRFLVLYGGRGAAKSTCVALFFIIKSLESKYRFLCTRELQVSISDSVHRLISDLVDKYELNKFFRIVKTGITTTTGSEFIFKGLRHNPHEIKSLEGIDYAWVEEAQGVSKESWDILIPTIRKPDSRIIITFNPNSPDDETYKRFVLSPPDKTLVKKVGFQDNPWFPEVLKSELEYCKRIDPELYLHIWEGNPRVISDAQIFKGRFVEDVFEAPDDAFFYHGADWGFAKDPTVLVRCFIQGNKLFIDNEAYGVGVELDETEQLFNSIASSRTHRIYADSARPETISFMKNKGFDIRPAKKWAGSVEDGIAFLKSFEKIVIHSRCKHTLEEFRLYSYKIDRNTQDILPVIVDKFNHCVAPGTLISTEFGKVPIENVQCGWKVKTRDGYKKVLWSGVSGFNKKTYTITLKNGKKLNVTGEHLIYCHGRDFTRADSLKYNDLLLVEVVKNLLLQPILKVEENREVSPLVYDLTVEDSHEYFADSILVHNCNDAIRYALNDLIQGKIPMKFTAVR